MIILGIDPGTARMGWGVIEIKNQPIRQAQGKKSKIKNKINLLGYGCVVTDKNDGVGKRLLVLRRELKKLIIDHQPDLMAIERLFFGMNAKTAIAVGQATGVIMLTAGELKIPTVEYTGLQVKLTVAGHGRADKKVLQTNVRRFLGINNLSFKGKKKGWDDASDALAIAICHVLK
ncbi:crossover junction endodeoxyribonuclease RuvC [Candidatus Microgenomates bacterium]|nr:crossover junction endodeoxyribonuclease RuvC [Candidatus Microgenomates bacterium]